MTDHSSSPNHDAPTPDAKPTLPPDSCPHDRRLTAICRQVVRDRKNKAAQRELAEEVVARMNAELKGLPE